MSYELDCTKALADAFLDGEDDEGLDALIVDWEPRGLEAAGVSAAPLITCVVSKRYEYAGVILEKMKQHPTPADEEILSRALLIAAGETERDSAALAEALLDAGADINARDEMRWTPAMRAALNAPEVTVLNLLLKRGADVNCKSSLGLTALMAGAARSDDNPSFVGMVLGYGAKTGARTNDGLSTLDIAKERGNDKIARFLETVSKRKVISFPGWVKISMQFAAGVLLLLCLEYGINKYASANSLSITEKFGERRYEEILDAMVRKKLGVYGLVLPENISSVAGYDLCMDIVMAKEKIDDALQEAENILPEDLLDKIEELWQEDTILAGEE